MIIGGVLLANWGGVKNRVAMIAGATLALGALSAALGLSTHLFAFLAFDSPGYLSRYGSAGRRRSRR